MNAQIRALILLGLIFSMLFLGGCRSSGPSPIDSSPTVIVSPANTIPVYSPSVEMTSTMEPVWTKTLSPTPTKTITPVPTDTPQPASTLTWTPRPTLPPDQAKAFALKMFKTNGGCRFPCFLGIIPGQTHWVEAEAFLATFADRIEGGNNNYSYGVDFTFSEPFGGRNQAGVGIYVEDGIVTGFQCVIPVSLQELLTSYGPPTEIYIEAVGWVTMASEGRFTLVLFYSEQGIMAIYRGDVAKGKTLYISPDMISYQRWAFLLWSPTLEMTFAEAAKRTQLITVPPPSEEDFVPIGEVTNLNVQSFYQRYKDPQNSGLYFTMEAPDYPKGKP